LNSQSLAEAVIWIALFLLISGPVHECAHAFVAWKLGDGTAKLFGRVSLDPIRHFDPIGGTLLIVSVMLSAMSNGAAIGFGWAKPTPVNPYNLRGRHADSMVALAGPLSNLALAAVFAVGFRILWANGIFPDNTSAVNMVQLVFLKGIELNIVLLLFNLIPIAPLDGSHVLLDFLEPRIAQDVRAFMNQYGMMLLIVVVIFAGQIIVPLLVPIVNLLIGVPGFLLT
jgi:Zn-dependent protease